MGEGKCAADETGLAAHETIVATPDAALDNIDGLIDPMSHTLIDGVLRAERADATIIRQRREGANAGRRIQAS